MPTQQFRAAAIQMRSGMDPQRNIAALTERVAEAVSMGAHYVQTPEMTGALVRERAALMSILCDEADDPVVAAASDLASRHAIYLHIGSTAIAVSGGKVANRAFVFNPQGGVVARYDKIHMFDVDLDNGESWRESTTYEAGRQAVVATPAFCQAGARHMLRRPVSGTFPETGACRCKCAECSGCLYAADRFRTLARFVARQGD